MSTVFMPRPAKPIGIRLEKAPRRMSHDDTMLLVEQLRAKSPKGTPLASMTPGQLKAELSKRD